MTTKLEQAARQLLEAVKSLPPRKGLLHAAFALEEELHRQDHSADSGNKVSDHIADAGKLMLTTEQAQQIEEALDELRYANNTDIAKTKYYKALAAIRAARAREQAEQRPQNCGTGYCSCIECPYEKHITREPDILSKSLKRIQSLERQLKTAQQQWNNSREYALELAERLFKYEGGSPMILNAEQAEQEPLMDYERINALREGEQNGAEDAYFFVRPENDTPTLRKMFCQGFERGFHKGLKYAATVQQVDLTDDEIDEIWKKHSGGNLGFAYAVIAADREKNK